MAVSSWEGGSTMASTMPILYTWADVDSIAGRAQNDFKCGVLKRTVTENKCIFTADQQCCCEGVQDLTPPPHTHTCSGRHSHTHTHQTKRMVLAPHSRTPQNACMLSSTRIVMSRPPATNQSRSCQCIEQQRQQIGANKHSSSTLVYLYPTRFTNSVLPNELYRQHTHPPMRLIVNPLHTTASSPLDPTSLSAT